MYCEECRSEKDAMDMHEPGLCKNCWLKELEDQKSETGMRSWVTRRERYGWKGHKGFYKGKKVEKYIQ